MGRSDVLKIARGARNARAVMRFLIFNILNKIVNQKNKNQKRDRQSALDAQLCSGLRTASSHVSFEPISYNLVIGKLSVKSFLGKRYELIKLLN